MHHIRISVLIWMVAGCLAGQDFQSLAQQAIQLQQAGNYVAAERLYRQLLAIDPNQVVTHVNLAIVLVNLGKFDAAIDQYHQAEKLLPGDPRIEMNLGLAYEKSGQTEQACRIFDQLHTAHPQDRQPAILLADCSLELDNDAQVVELLTPLASQNSDDLAISYMLGMALLHEHRDQEAQIQLDRILKNGNTAESHFLLGTRAFEAMNYPDAAREFRVAAALNPKLPQLQSFLGRALLYTGDPESAARAFRQELASNPNDYAANLGLAQILVAEKRYADAEVFAQRAHDARASSAEACLGLAQALAGKNQFASARPLAEKAAASLPNSAEAHRLLASVYRSLHLDTAARRERARAEQLDSLAAAAEPGPKINQFAPDFSLPRSDGSATISLHEFRGKSPVVLVFGSYTCPNFRDSAGALKSLESRFGRQIPFLLVYIREAHSASDWQSARSGSQDTLVQATDIREKEHHAAMCSRKLHLPFLAVVDGIDDAVENAYAAWPSRIFVVGEDGRIVYSSRLTQLDFRPETMEAVLRRLSKRASASAMSNQSPQ